MTLRALACVVLIAACGGNTGRAASENAGHGEQPAKPPPLQLPNGRASLIVAQRSAAALPGSSGTYEVRLDDITGGQVGLTIARADGGAVLVTRSVRARDEVPFTIDEHRYALVVVELANSALGQDVATLTVKDLQAAASVPEGATDQRGRIEALIGAIERADIVFVRNGKDHTPAEAAAHLRRKWEQAGDRIDTAEAFIEHLGSRSSQTGEPYRVRTPDGTEHEAGPWLREQLRTLEGGR